MGLLIGIGVLLVAFYGILSLSQTRREFHKRMEYVKRERDRIVGQLATLQAECEFLKVYQQGEIGALAQRLADEMAALESAFKETVSESDRLVTKRFSQLDRQVHLTRVLESFEKIGQEIPRVRKKLDEFHIALDKSRQIFAPLQNQFDEAKSKITSILGEQCPRDWINEWREIERGLTRLALGEVQADFDVPKSQYAETVELWLDTVQTVVIWSEWKVAYEERMKIFSTCLNRLRLSGAAKIGIFHMVEEMNTMTAEIVALEPRQLADKRIHDDCKKVKRELPTILSIAMRLLSVISHPETLGSILNQILHEARTILETIQSSDFIEKERLWTSENREQLEQKSIRVEQLIGTIARVTDNPPTSIDNIISDLDILLCIPAELQRYIEQVELFHHIHVAGTKELDVRLHAVLGNVSQAMAKLAESGFMNSDEYGKWSKWQEELHLQDGAKNIDAKWLARYERRIADELTIVEAIIRGHQSLDTSLQGSLDKLSRSGRFRDNPPPIDFVHGNDYGRGLTGDLLGIAFSSLMMNEIFNNDGWNNDNFDF